MKDIDAYLVWTAIVTPMLANGSIDYESFGALLKKQEAAGNALTILGSTGEALTIDESEKREILDFVLGLNLKVPIMVGIGGINLKLQKKWVEYLNTLVVDCYLMVVPLYSKPGVHGQYGWFRELLDISDKPCMLYNVPGRTAKELELEAAQMLADHPRFWAVKEASGSEESFSKYAKGLPNVRMMSGDDPMLPAFAKLGAKGVVSVAANVWPEATHEFARQCTNGTFMDNDIWQKSTKALFCASNPIPAKALLYDLGRIKSPELRLPLSSKDMPDPEVVRQANSDINSWFNNQSNS